MNDLSRDSVVAAMDAAIRMFLERDLKLQELDEAWDVSSVPFAYPIRVRAHEHAALTVRPAPAAAGAGKSETEPKGFPFDPNPTF